MSSVGQAVGMVVGGVIGFFAGGNVMLGASIGGAIGGAIDPPPGPKIEGPRLTDLTVQTSTYGARKNRAYGTVPIVGNVFWLEGDKYKEHKKTKKQGGKGGGGGAKTTTYSYSATFAVGLTEGQEITGIRRLWIGDNLVYDAGATNTQSIIASAQSAVSAMFSAAKINQQPSRISPAWILYTGADDQLPDPRIQADKGAANVSAYPGRAYIVFYDLDLTEKYSNTLLRAQVKAEVICLGAPGPDTVAIHDINIPAAPAYTTIWPVFASFGERSAIVQFLYDYNYSYHSWEKIETWKVEYGVTKEIINSFGVGYPILEYDKWFLYMLRHDLDSEVPPFCTYDITVSGLGIRYAVFVGNSQAVIDTGILALSAFPGIPGMCVIKNGYGYLGGVYGVGSIPFLKISTGICIASPDSFSTISFDVSENYIFILIADSSATTITIKRLLVTTLAIDSTMTISGDSRGAHVKAISDTVLNIVSNGGVYVVIDGIVSDHDSYVPENAPVSGNYWNLVQNMYWFEVANFSAGNTIGFASDPFPHQVGVPFSGTIAMSYRPLDANSATLREIVTAECLRSGLVSGDLDLSELVDSVVRGYVLSGVISPRAALEPLQAAWPFDVFQKGYKIGFKTRGSSSVATINETDLGSSAPGDGMDLLLPVVREMETQIARTVIVKYLDASRDYEIGEQIAPERPGVSSVEPRTVDLPIVLTADEAAQIADVLNAKEWIERVSFGPFTLPPTYLGLEAGDIVTINHRLRSWVARLTRIEYLPDGRLQCTAKLTTSSAYSSTAVGASPLVLGEAVVPLHGSSRVVLLDIPLLDQIQDTTGILVAMYGFTDTWPGAVLLRSDDGGQTWQDIDAFTDRTEVFRAVDTIGSAVTNRIDWSSVLTLEPAWSGADMFSITDDQLFSHGNIAAYGADGRWEIIGFKTVSLSSGIYTLSNFLRGRFGSEWAMSLHQPGDLVVMLDPLLIDFIGLPLSALNAQRLWRVVTIGDSIDTAPDINQTYGAVNLRPLSPVYLNGNRNPTTLDWTLTCTPRSRFPTEPFSGVATPDGESIASYEFDIYSSDYSTLKRTIASSTPSAPYSSALQVSDFGSNQSTIYSKSRKLSAIAGRGYDLTASIYRYMSLDPFGDKVVFLQRMQDTGLTDYKGHALTLYGNIARSGAQYVFSGSPFSAALDGTNDGFYLTNAVGGGDPDLVLGTGDFTIEFAVRPNSISAVMVIVDYRPGATNGNYPCLYLLATGQIEYIVNSVVRITGSHGVAANNWLQGALIRNAGITKLYVGSTQIGSSYTDTTNYISGGNRPALWMSGYSLGANCVNGYAGYLRITKAARDPAGMPPTIMFPDV